MAKDSRKRMVFTHFQALQGVFHMELPKRKKIRLEWYDYSSCGAHFATVCVVDRRALLWDAEADNIRLNKAPLSQYGKSVDAAIRAIPLHYDNAAVDKYCIMPDHIHMIIFILPGNNGRIISAPYVIGNNWFNEAMGLQASRLLNLAKIV